MSAVLTAHWRRSRSPGKWGGWCPRRWTLPGWWTGLGPQWQKRLCGESRMTDYCIIFVYLAKGIKGNQGWIVFCFVPFRTDALTVMRLQPGTLCRNTLQHLFFLTNGVKSYDTKQQCERKHNCLWPTSLLHWFVLQAQDFNKWRIIERDPAQIFHRCWIYCHPLSHYFSSAWMALN